VVIAPEPVSPEAEVEAAADAGAAADVDDDDELLQAAAKTAQAEASETAVAARHLRLGLLRCLRLARLRRDIALLPRSRRLRIFDSSRRRAGGVRVSGGTGRPGASPDLVVSDLSYTVQQISDVSRYGI
jgi:hypothetical protein